MFATDARRLGHVWSMLTGRRFLTADIHDLVADLRATLDEFGEPEDPADGPFGGPAGGRSGGSPDPVDPDPVDLAAQRDLAR